MAIDVAGVTGSVTDKDWAALFDALATGQRREYVPSGLTVTPSTGRVLTVTAGSSYQAGTLATMTPSTTVTIAANTASTARIDTVCMQVNWAGTEATAGSLVVVAGVAAANPVARGLTKTPGGIWQTPLAYVRVAAGASTLTAANITDARPGATDAAVIALTLAGSWVQDTPAIRVSRTGDGTVILSGRMQRTGGALAPGDIATFGDTAIVPTGYRPQSAAVAIGVGEAPGNPSIHRLVFTTDGGCTLTTMVGTMPSGTSLRVQNTPWLGE